MILCCCNEYIARNVFKKKKKLGYEVYNQWSVTENGFREWYKLIGRAVRVKKCDCNVEEKMKQLKMESRV